MAAGTRGVGPRAVAQLSAPELWARDRWACRNWPQVVVLPAALPGRPPRSGSSPCSGRSMSWFHPNQWSPSRRRRT